MENFEFPLVIFTVLSQLAVGFSFFACFRLYKSNDKSLVFGEWLSISIIMIIALIASLLHLGHPLHAPYALRNIFDSWLSKEAAVFGLFTFLCLLTWLTKANKLLASLTIFVGIIGIIIQGLTYAPIAMPAIYNAVPFVIFMLTTIILGTIADDFYAKKDSIDYSLVTKISLGFLVLILLILPCIWSAGGTIMYKTAIDWVYSSAYWAGIGINLLALLFICKKVTSLPEWFNLALVIISALLIRMVFFAYVVHTSTNIGNIY